VGVKVHDESPVQLAIGSSSPSATRSDVSSPMVGELSDATLDLIVGGLTTDAALARAAGFDQAGFPAR
jgi:hypothetical protein